MTNKLLAYCICTKTKPVKYLEILTDRCDKISYTYLSSSPYILLKNVYSTKKSAEARLAECKEYGIDTANLTISKVTVDYNIY